MKLLDAFCGEGGAAAGYQRAGFDVTGIDIKPRFAKRYPGRFIHADAIDYITAHGHEYDAIHASPPCQTYSRATAGNKAARDKYAALIPQTRTALQAAGRPYVIENVDDAGPELINPIRLCGTMLGLTTTDDDGTPLELWRHRWFEASFPLREPSPCRHGRYSPQVAGCYDGARRDKHEARHIRKGGYVPPKPILERLIGIDWMTEHGLFESIPPVYAEWVGLQLRQHLLAVNA